MTSQSENYDEASLDDLTNILNDVEQYLSESEDEDQSSSDNTDSESELSDAIADYKKRGFVPIPFQRLQVKDGKKNYIGLPSGWSKRTINTPVNAKSTDTGVCILTGKPSGITVFDFDDEEFYDELWLTNPELKEFYTVKTSRGYHVYFKYNPDLKCANDVCDLCPKAIDIKNDGGHCTTAPTSYGDFTYCHLNTNELTDIPEFLMDLLNEKAFKHAPAPETEVKEEHPKIAMETKMKIVDLINAKPYLDDHDSWRRIMFAMKREEYSREFAQNISKKSKTYTEHGFANCWDRAPTTINVSQGTLNRFAKLSDPEGYKKIFAKPQTPIPFDSDDATISDIIIKNIGDDFVMSDGKLYVFHKNEWEQNEAVASMHIRNFLNAYFTDLITEVNKEPASSKEETDARDKKIDLLITCRKKATNAKPLATLLIDLKMNLQARDIKKNIEFDVKCPHILRFNNMAFDVRTGEPYEVKRDDYLTQRTGFNYVEPTNEEMQTVRDMIESIFPDNEIRKTYLSVLKSGLTGIRPEKFFMANGVGRNGKGALNELMRSLLGSSYSYKGNITTLTRPLKDGPNPEVANMTNKRFVVFNEPNGKDTLKLGNIKSLTGDNEINARQCQSNKTSTTLINTIVFECNKKPNIDDRIDNSVISRFVNIYFPSIFTDDEKVLAEIPHAHPINKQMKETTFKEKHRCALFHYLIQNGLDELYIADEIITQTKEYLVSNDEFYNWFEDNYIACKKEHVRVRDLYGHFKESEYYNDLPKAERRTMTEKRFKSEIVRENIKVKDYYHERIKLKGEDLRNVIINFRKKTHDERFGDEDDE